MQNVILVMSCMNEKELQKFLFNIPLNKNYQRVFIYFDYEDENIKNILTPQDKIIFLGKLDTTFNIKEIVLRAGLLYFNYWIILFIENPIVEDEIIQAIIECEENGKYSNNYIKGASKEYLIFNGFEVFGDESIKNIDKSKIGWAMRGMEVDEDVLKLAILENISEFNFILHNSLSIDEIKYWKNVAKSIKNTSNITETLAISSKVNLKTLHQNLIADGRTSIVMRVNKTDEEFWDKYLKVLKMRTKDYVIYIIPGGYDLTKTTFV